MKKIYMLLAPLLLIGLICITGCSLFGGKDDTDTSNYNININSDKNIKTNAYISFDKSQLIIYMTNNYSYNVGSLEVEAIYYDKDGNKIGDDIGSVLGFKSGSDAVISAYLPSNSDYEYYVPDRVEIKVSIDEEYQAAVGGGTLYNDKIETSHKVNGKDVEVTLKNNSGKTMTEIQAVVLYMKGNKPIAAQGIRGTDVSSSYSESIGIPYDYSKEESDLIKYDSIKIIINRAKEGYQWVGNVKGVLTGKSTTTNQYTQSSSNVQYFNASFFVSSGKCTYMFGVPK